MTGACRVEHLIALRRNVLTFYTGRGIGWSSSGGSGSRDAGKLRLAATEAARAAGADVGHAIPRRGALAWLDCWAISRGVRDKALAEAWIDFLLEPGPGQVSTTNWQGWPPPHPVPGPRGRQAGLALSHRKHRAQDAPVGTHHFR